MSVRIERGGWVWTVVHSRPEARNAMDPASADALCDAFRQFDADPEARVAVLWGEGGAFCAGWDLKHVAGFSKNGGSGPLAGLSFPDDDRPPPRGPLGPTRLMLDKPVIAAVAGPAVAGGMELALWCDLRVMEESAYLGVYCRRWGIPLLDGGTVRLPRLVGQARALDIILTGRDVPADECLRIGACDRVVPDGESRERAEELAQQIAGFPFECVKADRRSVYLAHGRAVSEGLRLEWSNSASVVASEGISGAARFAAGKGRHGDFVDIH